MGIEAHDIDKAVMATAHRVDTPAVLAFALATGGDADACARRGTAPTTFAAACWQPPLRSLLSSLLTNDELGGCVHLSQTMTCHRDVPIGAVVRADACLAASKGSNFGGVIAVRLRAWDDDGPLADAVHRVLVRGVRCATAGAATEAPPKPPPTRTRTELGEVSFEVGTDLPIRYSRASGDDLPIHTDREFARKQGFPRLILHGMATLALCGNAVARVTGEDATRVRRLAATFSKPVLVDDILTVKVDSTGDALWFGARQGAQAVIRDGFAEVELR